VQDENSRHLSSSNGSGLEQDLSRESPETRRGTLAWPIRGVTPTGRQHRSLLVAPHGLEDPATAVAGAGRQSQQVQQDSSGHVTRSADGGAHREAAATRSPERRLTMEQAPKAPAASSACPRVTEVEAVRAPPSLSARHEARAALIGANEPRPPRARGSPAQCTGASRANGRARRPRHPQFTASARPARGVAPAGSPAGPDPRARRRAVERPARFFPAAGSRPSCPQRAVHLGQSDVGTTPRAHLMYVAAAAPGRR